MNSTCDAGAELNGATYTVRRESELGLGLDRLTEEQNWNNCKYCNKL